MGVSPGTATFKFDFPILWAGPSAYLVFPDLIPHTRLRFGGGGGYVFLLGASGTYDITITDAGLSGGTNETSNFSGSAWGGKLDLGLDWIFSDSYSMSIDAGYRMASISTITENPVYFTDAYHGNGTLLQADGSHLPLDYSGFFVKLSLGNWY